MSRYDVVCFDRFGCDIWLILTFMTLMVLSIKSNVSALPKRWECNDCAYNVEEVFGVKPWKWSDFGESGKLSATL